jgi:hypothetical protein
MNTTEKIRDIKGLEILRQNNQKEAKWLLSYLQRHNIPKNCPEIHAKLLGYPYNKGEFEADSTNGVRRIMVELKLLALFGKHNCPDILLR